MNKWKQLLADKSIANDVQITIGTQNFTVGELRAAEVESEGALSTKLQERETHLNEQQRLQENAVNNFAKILETVSQKTGLGIDQLISNDLSNARPVTAQPAPDNDFWNKDEYKPIKAKLDPMEQQLNRLTKTLSDVLKVYMNDHAEQEFSRYQMPELPTGSAPITLEKALGFAMQNKYVDGVGRPNVRKALDEMTQPFRQKKSEEQIRTEAFEEGKKAAQMAQFAEPSNGAGGIQFDSSPAKGNSKDIPSIKDVLDKAWQDQSIIQTLRTQ